MNLQSNDFELFGLALRFEQDRAAIDDRWKDLQREALDEARDAVELDRLASEVRSVRQDALQECARLLDVERDYVAAVRQVRALMFIERFAGDVEAKMDRIDAAEQGQ